MGESMRRLPRLLVGLMLGMALVVGLGARVALAVDPTYTISVNGTAVKTDAALNTQCAYTIPAPEGFSQFLNPATSVTGIVTSAGAAFENTAWTITFSVNAAGTGTVTVNWKDASEGHTETLNISCTQNIPINGVSVDSTATVGVGKTITLKPTVTPDNATYKTVTWMPDDSGVAIVDENGAVTGLKVGTGTITVKATNGTDTTDDDDKVATCEVTVIQLVESVELNKTTATIEVGATDQLTATVKPDDATNKAVTWSSDDTSVATVDENGKVKGLKAGEATIIATATNGTEDTADDKVATCKVTVAQPTYTATTGAGATWTKGNTDGLPITFTRMVGNEESNTAFTHFQSASVDGKPLTKDEDYTATEGSVVITLSPAYLNTLPTGEHTLTANFNDGTASANFSVTVNPPAPTMSNSRGGTFTSTTETVTYTITQEVPSWASSMRTWVDLESVLEFVSDATVTCDGKQVSSATVVIDGQKLTVTIPDVTEYRGKTIQITYSAKLRSNANLDPYLNAKGDTASVPYQAHTIFDEDETTKVSSNKEAVNFKVGNSSSGSNSSTTKTSTPSTASTTSTLAKTGDTTSFTAVAAMAVTGASALVVGRRRKR